MNNIINAGEKDKAYLFLEEKNKQLLSAVVINRKKNNRINNIRQRNTGSWNPLDASPVSYL